MIAEPLTDEAFQPFGRVLGRPVEAPAAQGPGWSWWGETEELPAGEEPYAVGYLELEPTEPIVDWAERHRRSPELIVPLGGDCVVYVAPPAALPDGFRAFRVEAGTAVLLDPGVWHGAPFAVDRPVAAAVFLLRGTGRTDTVLHRFADTPIRIEV